MVRGRDIIIYLSIKYNGEWDAIYNAIKTKEEIDFSTVEKTISTNKANVVTIIDENYPQCLKNIFHPPFVLYYYGDISLIANDRQNLSVIGSRSCSRYGEKITKDLVSSICSKFNIVSGMAKGIDSVAHNQAIVSGGRTIAVLGSGIEHCYPKSNLDLYEKIKQSHLLISEYPNQCVPTPTNFISRNRIIAALSKAILITEAKEKSGTLTTVSFGLQFGKDVFCVPYPAGEKSVCNRLIRDGASLIENADDLSQELE